MRSKAFRSLILFFSCVVLAAVSCKKDDNNQKVAGKIVLEVYITHHQIPVPNIPVYLKLNTSSFPGNDSTKYDLKVKTNVSGKAFFTELTPGNHYLYSYGLDAGVGENVIGYQPLTISSSTVVNDTVKTQLFVSE